MSREDPKPGRWILPLVVAGIIGFTYTFVNALPAATVADATGETVATTTTTTTRAPTTTTSTTLAPDVQSFIDTVDGLSAAAAALAETARTANDEWDARNIEFSDARAALEGLVEDTDAFADDVANVELLADAAESWEDVLAGTADMQTAAAGMLDGLVNQEGSEGRLSALNDYESAESAVQAGFTAAVRAVGG